MKIAIICRSFFGRCAGVVIIAVFVAVNSGCTDRPDSEPADAADELPAPPPEESPTRDADLVVIGAGLAGLSAAIEAASRGRSVLVIDMASVFGGHAVMSAGGMAIIDSPMQRDQGIADSPELAFADFVNWGEDINEPWARYYVENSSEMIFDWATGLGVKFNFILKPAGNSVPRMHFPEGLGLGLIAPIVRKAIEQPNIDFRWNTRADALITSDGRVIGVTTTNTRTDENQDYYGHAVVIATGGYQSNLARVRQNWRSDWPEPGTILAGSGWNSRGSGLDLATAVGAQLVRMEYTWNYVTGVPDPRYDNAERGLRMFIEPGQPRADIWLNDDGERFINECLSPKFALATVLEQPGKSHWLLFDSRMQTQIGVAGTGWTPEKVDSLIFQNRELMNTADTLEGLADQMGVDSEKLIETIARYNGFVDSGQDEDFLRFGSNRDPRGGCQPDAGIDQPPYFAIKRYPLTRKSMGGISIDLKTRVLNTDGNVIPGLYAAGEATGLAGVNGRAGLEGTFLGPSLLTGRVVGRSVAEELSSLPVSPVSRDPQAGSANISETTGPDCTTCHNIPALVGAGRPGYQHFERAHELILEREQDCNDCHTGMAPFDSGRHRIQARNLVDTCDHCHGSGGD